MEDFEVALHARVAELERMLEKSAANHNAIAGAFNEAKKSLEMFVKSRDPKPAVDDGQQSVA